MSNLKKKFIYKKKEKKHPILENLIEKKREITIQKKLITLFNKLLNKTNLTNFNLQKKILYLLDDNTFKKKLEIFSKLYLISPDYKKFILEIRQKFLIFLKLKKRRRSKTKKLASYLKLFLLNNYSILFKFNLLKKKIFLQTPQTSLYLLYINIRSNNIFINLYSHKNYNFKLIKFWSCGVLKFHCTKRKLKFTIYTILKEIKRQIKYISFFIVKVFCAHFLHKFLYRNLKKLFFKFKFIIFNSFKIFNGCRSKKKRRKKHLKFRVFR